MVNSRWPLPVSVHALRRRRLQPSTAVRPPLSLSFFLLRVHPRAREVRLGIMEWISGDQVGRVKRWCCLIPSEPPVAPCVSQSPLSFPPPISLSPSLSFSVSFELSCIQTWPRSVQPIARRTSQPLSLCSCAACRSVRASPRVALTIRCHPSLSPVLLVWHVVMETNGEGWKWRRVSPADGEAVVVDVGRR